MRNYLLGALAALTAVTFIVALAGCSSGLDNGEGQSCRDLKEGDWVTVQGHVGIVDGFWDAHTARVRYPGLQYWYPYPCAELTGQP